MTVFEGVRDRLSGIATVETTPGVQLSRRYPSPLAMLIGPVKPWTPAQAADELQKAVDLAARADVVILTLGEKIEMSSEQASRSDLALPGDQRQAARRGAGDGQAVVVVLMNGRPLDLTGVYDKVPAILVARALFGDVDPGGKTPVTWPRSVGQVPTYYARNLTHDPDIAGQRYQDAPSTPLIPFGFGPSYTSFTIAPPTVNRAVLAPGGRVAVSTMVADTGTRAGDEVVQIHVHQRAGRASRPVRLLQGFRRITLAPGERRQVTFMPDERDVRYCNPVERGRAIDPGTFDLWVGNSSTADAHAVFTVGGAPRRAQ